MATRARKRPFLRPTHPAVRQSYAFLYAAANNPDENIWERMRAACEAIFKDLSLVDRPFSFNSVVNNALRSGEIDMDRNGRISITVQGAENLHMLRNGFITDIEVPLPEASEVVSQVA